MKMESVHRLRRGVGQHILKTADPDGALISCVKAGFASRLRAGRPTDTGVRPGWSTLDALETPRVLEFDQELVGIELPPIQHRTYVVVVDDEEIGHRTECPT